MTKNSEILLVGAGYMGVEYARVLKKLKLNFLVVSRGQKLANKLEEVVGKKVIIGGIDKWLSLNKQIPKIAIVATPSDTLGKITLELLSRGVKQILVEKPGGANEKEIVKINKLTNKTHAEVYVGYNRRFYASVNQGLKIIKKDRGITSFMFEFTEWSHVIKDLNKSREIKARWFLHNSTHVVDMAFFMCGKPTKIATFTSGSLDWHPKASAFSGAGVVKNNIPFSYIANWDAPGRWGVEIMTKRHRLIYKPLEKLHIQRKGTVAVEEVKIDDKLDTKFKPGLYKQVQSFLTNKNNLCAINEQAENIKLYRKILK